MIGLQAMCFWAIMSFSVMTYVLTYERKNFLEYVIERGGNE